MKGAMEALRKARRMPWLKRGMDIDIEGKRGKVVGANSSYNLQVKFDGDRWSRNYHPWWQTTYYSSGKVIADYKNQQQEGGGRG